MKRVVAASFCLFFVSGCSGWDRCGPGMSPGEGGDCELVIPHRECEPGTMPRIGSEECTPVGWSECPSGFDPSGDGWGCTPVLAERCDGSEMARLGETRCAPIGRCTAAFPPPDATHFVDPALGDDEVDGNRFGSIVSAVEAAPEGSVIAVADGLYRESVVVNRRLRLVGRCPERAGITTAQLGYPGLTIAGATDVTIEGLLVRDAYPGLYIGAGAEVTLRHMLLLGNEGAGLYTTGGAAVRLEQSVVRQTLPYDDGTGGWGVAADAGSRVEILDSVLDRNVEAALFVMDTGTAGTVDRSVIRSTYGRAVSAQDGAVSTIRESALVGNFGLGLFAADPGTEIHLLASVVDGPQNAPRAYRGANIQSGARLVVEEGVISGMREVALYVSAARAELNGLVVTGPAGDLDPDDPAYGFSIQSGAVVEAEGIVVRGRRDAGILVREESRLELMGSLIAGTTAGHADPVGLVVMGTAEVTESTLEDNHGAGGVIYTGGRLDLNRALVRGSRQVDDIFGHGLIVLGGHLEARRTAIDRSEGIALAVIAGRALADESVLSENQTALHVIPPVTVREADAPRPPEENELLVTRSTRFIDNQSRLGSGHLVIPIHAGLED